MFWDFLQAYVILDNKRERLGRGKPRRVVNPTKVRVQTPSQQSPTPANIQHLGVTERKSHTFPFVTRPGNYSLIVNETGQQDAED